MQAAVGTFGRVQNRDRKHAACRKPCSDSLPASKTSADGSTWPIDWHAPWLTPERHPEMGEKLFGFLVRRGRRDESNVHPFGLLDPVEVDLRKDDLFFETERVVAGAVERLGGGSAEVA